MSLELMKKKTPSLKYCSRSLQQQFCGTEFFSFLTLFRDLNSFSLKIKISEILGPKTAEKFNKKSNMF